MLQQDKTPSSERKLLIIDSAVLDSDVLLKNRKPGYELIRLKPDTDPIQQITQALTANAPVAELVLVAHATPGQIHFSNDCVDTARLEQYRERLQDWRKLLAADAKLCVYACELAAGKTGRAFIEQLKALTGAEVAASSLPVGSTETGQNWDLNRLTDSFEVFNPFHINSREKYSYTLEPVISINRVVSVLEVAEGDSSIRQLEFKVTLSEPATNTVDILYRTLDGQGTAAGGADYVEEFSFVRILAGQSSTTLNITVAGDTSEETDESVVVELYNPENAVFANNATTLRATGVILDDDGTTNDRALFVSQVQVVEGDDGSQLAVFDVQLSRPSTSAIVLDYTTSDGSALAGQDYQAVTDSLTFTPGETLKSVAVPLIGDTVAENNEFFNLVFTPTSDIANGVDGAVGTAVILDDDTNESLPEISISGGRTIEGPNSIRQLEFEVTLSEPATNTVDILYRTLDSQGTAIGSVDHVGEFSFVRILAGQSSTTLNITVAGDTSEETDESVVVELYNPENAVFANNATTLRATGVILDDDGTTNDRALFVSQVQVVEGDDGSQLAVFDVQLSRPSTSAIVLDYTTSDGSALAGQDYQAVTDSLTFTPGETLKSVAVPLIGDTVAENNEFFNLVFTPTSDIANGVDGAVGTAVILDDDTNESLPEISISGGRTIEGPNSIRQLEFEVTLSEPATNTVDILYRTLDSQGTAIGSVDHVGEFSFVRILAGQSSTTLNITVAGDTSEETDESVVVELYNPENAVFANNATTLRATGVILDDDGTTNDRALFVSQVQVVEGDDGSQLAVFDVQLSRPSTSAIVLDYTTSDGSALAGQDYQAVTDSLTFTPGETLKSVAVPLIGDTVAENNEFFNLVFTPTSDIANGVDGAVGTAVILDDDTNESLPEISISGGRTIEGPNSIRQLEFEVTLSEPATNTVDILYRTLDSQGTAIGSVDHVGEFSFVRILAGQSSTTLNITVAGDTSEETDESVVVELYNPENAVFANNATTLRATGVILDDDGTTNDRALFVSQVQVVEGDDGSQLAVFDVQLSRPSTSAIVLDYTTSDGSALAGQDYQAVTDSLTFTPGETLKSVAVPLIGDTVAENNEFFNLVFTPTSDIANGADGAVGTAVILDDDTNESLPEISISGGRTIEGPNSIRQLEFEVTLSEPATNTVDILYRTLDSQGTAIGSVDHVGEFSFVRILAGQSSTTLNITVAGDTSEETDESVVVELYNPENAVFANNATTLRATGVILDDDGTTNDRALFVSQVQVVEGDDGSQLAVFDVQLSRPSTSAIVLDYTTSDGSALAGQDYQAVTDSLTFTPGETLKSVAVPLIGDTVAENNEFFNLVFTPTSDIANGADGAVGTAVILDDDTNESLPEISISGGRTIEGPNSIRQLEFEVTLSEPATNTVDILYRTLDDQGTATTGTDYVEEFSFVRILAGQSSATLNITVSGDAVDEADESVVVELFSPENAVFPDEVDTLQATGIIHDDDGTGNNLSLFVGNTQIVEGADGANRDVAVPVYLSRPSDQTLTFQYQTANDTAIAGSDYSAQSGTVTFLPGETKSAVHIPVIGDDVEEPSETFTLTVTPTAAIANGSDGATGTVTILDGDIPPPPTGIVVNAGNNAIVSEGSLFTRTITFIDDLDTGDDGWTYNVDWGDGSAVENGVIAAGANSFDIGRAFADDDAAHTVSVTVTDAAGDTDTQQFQLDINNVAPTIALSGDSETNAGASYALNLGAVTDPGKDTVTSYIVDWGDGSSDTFSTAGEVNHIYATTGSNTISVDLVDEDGTHVNAGTFAVLVNTAPDGVSVNAGNDASIDEGGAFNRTVTFTDGEDTGNDGWTYSVDWGDGSAVENGVIAAGANSFDISRAFADGDAAHTVSVTVTDAAGDTDTQQFQLDINNVAPTIALSGDSETNAGASYALNLGAVTDPGKDTVTSYIVDWGDGSSDTFSTAGEVNHVYAATGSNTISVDLVDEDGTHVNAGTFAVLVNAAPDGVSVNAGNDASTDEGGAFNRTVTFTDGEDTGNDGWTYSVDWGDGSAVENGVIAAGANSFDIGRAFADGDAAHTVSVTVTDVAGDSDTQQFQLDINNVAPTIDLLGNDSVNEGETYTLNLANLIDPGDDTVTSYTINWGDGSTTTLSAVELLAAGNAVDHVFADGASSPQITVDLTDEDGTHAAGSKTINVNNIAPTVALSGNAAVDEGSTYTLALGAVTDPGTDTVTDYIIHWGDGSPSTSLTTAELAATGGNVDHVYADGASNPQISVDLVDEDGTHTAASILNLTVNNVVPTITVAGASQVNAGTQYTFNLGTVTDPGDDTVSSYIVNWGDGSSDTYNTAGDVTHTYVATGDNTITVDLVDEDGAHINAGSLNVTVEQPEPVETIFIGNAPLRVSRSDPNAWENAWTNEAVSISHKADLQDNAEIWSDVTLNGRNPGVLNGGDLFGGDLGVSGQSLVSSSIRQEIDGTEALRFELQESATTVSVDITRLQGNSGDGSFDAGRLQLFDQNGLFIDEAVFSADAQGQDAHITLTHNAGFSSVVLSAGVYNGTDFVFGGLADSSGQYLSDPQDLGNGTWNGSDYLVDAIEFEFGEITLIGTPA